MSDAPDLDQLAGVPATFGGFKILELIEEDGGARLFLARQASVDRLVLLTVLPRPHAEEAAFRRRFDRQIEAASRLNHPNVVRAVDAGSVGGHQFIASEYSGGRRLSDALAQREWFPKRRCVRIAQDIADALEHLESHHVIHRGLTPRTIVLAESGVAKLRGFSLSRLTEADGSQTWFDVDVYAARYMSPEIIQSAPIVGTRADIYSFGCVLYHLITGRPPFTGEHALAVKKQHLEESPPDARPLRDDIPEGLHVVLMKCLQKDPGARYRTAADLAADVRAVSKGAPATPPEPPRRPGGGWLKRLFTTPD